MASVLGSFIAIKFIELYTKDFKKWPAYKMGLIDDKGKKIKEAETQKEKAEFISWKNLIRKLKIILDKLPLGQFGHRLASFASAFWLLREEFNNEGYNGQEIINSLYERILLDNDFNQLITEDVSIKAGSYALVDKTQGPSYFKISEDQLPIGNVFNVNVYKVTDLITNEDHIVSSMDIIQL